MGPTVGDPFAMDGNRFQMNPVSIDSENLFQLNSNSNPRPQALSQITAQTNSNEHTSPLSKVITVNRRIDVPNESD